MFALLKRQFISSFIAPQESFVIPVATVTSQPLIMRIRRHKMNRHKYLKRLKRDWWQIKKRHAQKKQRAEDLFRGRMREILAEFERFDPLEYVKETMEKANKDWRVDVEPSGRKKFPHWSTLMSLEELYSVEKDDYIDKRFGLPSSEECPILNKLCADYQRHYIVGPPKEFLEKIRKNEEEERRKILEMSGYSITKIEGKSEEK
ncbi:hypothetical protein ACQ4LE_007678 [Meloidogyne hapla]|uniref:Mitochondrial mRNA-processing protein COX24 C-terminal domain-containing protein n=1 Tax=Meloidogyne hapla TaxID=6305 RepID=A0A1I8BS49_MELHA